MGSVTAPHFRPRVLAFAPLVAAGSTVGTMVRASIEAAFPAHAGEWPWATFLINVVGSFLLGGLLEVVARAGADTGWRRRVRLGVGTGVIGGFTTYSTYVVEVDQLARAGYPLAATAYAAISVVGGLLAAGVGVAMAGALPRPSGQGRP